MPTSAKIFTVCGAGGVLLVALCAALILLNQNAAKLYREGVPRNARVIEMADRLLQPDMTDGRRGRFWAVLEIPGRAGAWRHDARLTPSQYQKLEVGEITPVVVAGDGSDRVYVGTFAEAHADQQHTTRIAIGAGVCGMACATVGFVVWLLFPSLPAAADEIAAGRSREAGRLTWEVT